MKKVILLLHCILSISLINTGVCIETVVDTPEGLKEIKILKAGDIIFCCNANLQHETGSIVTVQEIEVNSVVEITTTDGFTITVAADQKLFVTHKWVQANQLTLEDVLFTKDHAFVGITCIRYLQKPTTLRFVTIDKNPTYWAAENGILIHNGPITGAVLGVGTRVVGYGGLAIGTIAAFFGIAAGTPGAIAAGAAALEIAGGTGAGPLVAYGLAATGETTCAVTGGATAAVAVKAAITGTTVLAAKVGAAIEATANTATVFGTMIPFLP